MADAAAPAPAPAAVSTDASKAGDLDKMVCRQMAPATGTRIGDPLRTDARTLGPAVLRPDGLEMAVSMPAGVMLWDLDPEHQFEYACRLAGRDLTEEEWRTYLGSLGEQQSTCGFD